MLKYLMVVTSCLAAPRLTPGLSQVSQAARLAWIKVNILDLEGLTPKEKSELNISGANQNLKIEPAGIQESRFNYFPNQIHSVNYPGLTAMVDYEIKTGGEKSWNLISYLLDAEKSSKLKPALFLILTPLAKQALTNPQVLPLYFKVLSRLTLEDSSWIEHSDKEAFMDKFFDEIFNDLSGDCVDFGLVTLAAMTPHFALRFLSLNKQVMVTRAHHFRQMAKTVLGLEQWAPARNGLIEPEALQNFLEKYPNDKAVGENFKSAAFVMRRIRELLLRSPFLQDLIGSKTCAKYLGS